MTSNVAQGFANEVVMSKVRFLNSRVASTMGSVALMLSVACAQAEKCAIPVARGTPVNRVAQFAKVSRVDAENTALAYVNADRSTKVASSEMEAEDGCLIWTFDLRMAGQPGITEVHVDAGDGKVLAVEHE